MFSKKAIKIDEIFTVDLTLWSKRQIEGLLCTGGNSFDHQQHDQERKGPSIIYVVLVGGEGGQKLRILRNKKTTKRGEGV